MRAAAILCASVLATACASVPPSRGESRSHAAALAAAHAHLRLEEPAETARWLASVPAAERGWEWRYLAANADQSVTTAELGAGPVWALARSSDGEWLATGGADGTIALRDAATGTALRKLEGHSRAVYALDFSPDGTRLVSASEDGTARTWDVATGTTVATFKHELPVAVALFTADGTMVVTGNYASKPGWPVVGTLKIWDPETGVEKGILQGGVKPLVAAGLSPDGRHIAAASWNFCVFVWDIDSHELVHTLKVADDGLYNAADAVAWSPDGRWIAGCSRDGKTTVWDAVTGQEVAVVRGHKGAHSAAAFLDGGRMLATAGADSAIIVWDTATWTERARLRGHTGSLRTLLADGKGGLLSAGEDGTLRSWLPGERTGDTIIKDAQGTGVVAISPDGSTLLSCVFDGDVSLRDLYSGELRRLWHAHGDGTCNTAAFDRDATRIATCSWNGETRVWDAGSGAMIGEAKQETGVGWVSWSPDGRLLATSGRERAVRIRDAATMEERHRVALEAGAAESLAWSPDGSTLAAAGPGSRITLIDPVGGLVRATIPCGSGRVMTAAYSPNGASLASGGDDGMLRLLDAKSGQLMWSAGAGAAVNRIAFSPDGSRIATAGADGTARLFDAATGERVLNLALHPSSMWSLCWSPDGTRLVTSSMDGTIIVNDSRPQSHR